MTEARRKFDAHPNSIQERLNQMDPETRRRYRKNEAKHAGDQSALEAWAAGGFAPIESDEN